MTGVTCRLKRRGPRLELAFPLSMRVILGAIAALVFVAMVAGRAFLGFPIVLTAVCVLAALYDERWVFDISARRVTRRRGLVFLAASESIPFDDIEELYVSHFVKGSPAHFPQAKVESFRRHQVTLYLWMRSGERRTVESRPSDHALDLVDMAKEIGIATGIPVGSQ